MLLKVFNDVLSCVFLGMEIFLFDGILHIQFCLKQFQILPCYYLFPEVIRAEAETCFPVQIQKLFHVTLVSDDRHHFRAHKG